MDTTQDAQRALETIHATCTAIALLLSQLRAAFSALPEEIVPLTTADQAWIGASRVEPAPNAVIGEFRTVSAAFVACADALEQWQSVRSRIMHNDRDLESARLMRKSLG